MRSEVRTGTLDIGSTVTYPPTLNNVDGTQLECSFGDAASSALLCVPSQPDFKYVVMPMRI
jgi:DNA polymerase-3 subunit beta